MVKITISSVTPSSIPAQGFRIGYRVLGTTGAYLTPTGSPFFSVPIQFTTNDPAGTLYEGYIQRDCGTGSPSTLYFFQTTCNCTDNTYTLSASGLRCEKTTVIAATVTNSGYCLAPSPNVVYSTFGARIYKPGFTTADLTSSLGTTSAGIDRELGTADQWKNATNSIASGPMNREAVWIDSDCDGVKNGLGSYLSTVSNIVPGSGYVDGVYNNVTLTYTSGGVPPTTNAKANITVSGGGITVVEIVDGGNGYEEGMLLSASNSQLGGSGSGFTCTVNTVILQQTTIAYVYNNPGAQKTIYIGAGGDNQFDIKVNSTLIVSSGDIGDTEFKIWHLMPVTVNKGLNYINIVATGDGSVNDAIAMVVYDNTADELAAATSTGTTADIGLTILFKSSQLNGTTYDVATCPDGYSLDTSGGSGSYVCKHIDYKPCNSIS